MEIADTDGLTAVSMSSVATRLGYTTMSLYRYVSAKDDLIVLMNDEGLGEPPDHEPVDDDWRTGLRRWARSVMARYLHHPWLLDIPVDGVPITPNNLAWLDWGLRLLAPARMAPAAAVAAVLMISGLSRWQAVIDRATASGEQLEAEQFVFGELVTPMRYPALSLALREGGLSDDEADDPFVFALERALDGLERSVGSREHPSGPAPASDETPATGEHDYPRDARLKEATRARREAEARVREAESTLRDARRKEAELIARARQLAAATSERR
jgi:AcrR family transcriptional regulator